MPFSAVSVARSFDREIRAVGQEVSIYRPGRTTAAGIVTENTPVLVGTTMAQLQFGSSAQDLAMTLGVDPNKSCKAFFLSSAVSLVTHRAWVKDADGGWWLIHSPPKAPGLPQPIGVNALLTRTDKPVGVV